MRQPLLDMEFLKTLLLSQQAEAIAQKYMEDCIDGIREQLKKQGQDEIKATERAMAVRCGGGAIQSSRKKSRIGDWIT